MSQPSMTMKTNSACAKKKMKLEKGLEVPPHTEWPGEYQSKVIDEKN